MTIGDEDPEYTGGSYAVVQKYVHDLDSWDALPVELQEHAIGRTKLEDVELPDDVKPADSHVALNTIVDEDGEEHKIMRFNTETAQATQYPLPHATNVRRVFVDNSTTPPTFWVGNNHGAAIIKLEPYD